MSNLHQDSWGTHLELDCTFREFFNHRDSRKLTIGNLDRDFLKRQASWDFDQEFSSLRQQFGSYFSSKSINDLKAPYYPNPSLRSSKWFNLSKSRLIFSKPFVEILLHLEGFFFKCLHYKYCKRFKVTPLNELRFFFKAFVTKLTPLFVTFADLEISQFSLLIDFYRARLRERFRKELRFFRRSLILFSLVSVQVMHLIFHLIWKAIEIPCTLDSLELFFLYSLFA